MAIGKNRKYLLEIFKQLSQNGTIPMYEEVLKLHINRQLNQRLTECWDLKELWLERNSGLNWYHGLRRMGK